MPPRGFAVLDSDRSTRAVQVGIRLPIELLLRLRRAAASERKSLNLYVNDLLAATHPVGSEEDR